MGIHYMKRMTMGSHKKFQIKKKILLVRDATRMLKKKSVLIILLRGVLQ